jgi:hypothetical protein
MRSHLPIGDSLEPRKTHAPDSSHGSPHQWTRTEGGAMKRVVLRIAIALGSLATLALAGGAH